jgi:hypothetical protein
MDRSESLHGRTTAALERGSGDTERLATEWAMPFLPDDGGNSPTDVPFRGGSPPRRPVSGFVTFTGRLMMIFGLFVLLGGIYAGFQMMSRDASSVLEPKVIQVEGVPAVRIENTVGSVRVVAGTGNEVEVRAEVHVEHLSRGLAEQALKNYELAASQNPETGVIEIRAGDGQPFGGDGFLDGMFLRRSVRMTVTMPANANLDLNVAAGTMNVTGITGKVNAEVNAGSLNITESKLADGSTFKVNAGGMFFRGELVPDASIDVEVNAGGAEFVLPQETAARLIGTADAGGVSASGWTGTISEDRIHGNDNSRIDGYLTGVENTKSVITVTVHAGAAEINSNRRSERDPVPSMPGAPPAPSGPGEASQ